MLGRGWEQAKRLAKVRRIGIGVGVVWVTP
jgi:hypothetical protein